MVCFCVFAAVANVLFSSFLCFRGVFYSCFFGFGRFCVRWGPKGPTSPKPSFFGVSVCVCARVCVLGFCFFCCLGFWLLFISFCLCLLECFGCCPFLFFGICLVFLCSFVCVSSFLFLLECFCAWGGLPLFVLCDCWSVLGVVVFFVSFVFVWLLGVFAYFFLTVFLPAILTFWFNVGSKFVFDFCVWFLLFVILKCVSCFKMFLCVVFLL